LRILWPDEFDPKCKSIFTCGVRNIATTGNKSILVDFILALLEIRYFYWSFTLMVKNTPVEIIFLLPVKTFCLLVSPIGVVDVISSNQHGADCRVDRFGITTGYILSRICIIHALTKKRCFVHMGWDAFANAWIGQADSRSVCRFPLTRPAIAIQFIRPAGRPARQKKNL
jgi:hypothetical protein